MREVHAPQISLQRMPDRNIGVVVMANAYNPMPDVVAMLVYDKLLGRATAQTQFDEDMKKIRERVASRPQRNAELAKKIAAEGEENGELHATIGDRSGQLIRARGDGFYVQWYPDDGVDRLTFTQQSLKWMDRELHRQ